MGNSTEESFCIDSIDRSVFPSASGPGEPTIERQLSSFGVALTAFPET